MANLNEAIKDASKELSEEMIVDLVEACERSVRAKIAMKKWKDNISRPIQLPSLTAKLLFSYFMDQYAKQYGTIEKNEYWLEAAQKIAAILSKDLQACEYLKVTPNKGVLLVGGVGVGKTSMMKTFAIVLSLNNNPDFPAFRTANTNEIANKYREGGALTINKYASEINEGMLKNAGWFFDDLGNETSANNFGNVSNVIEEIIQQLYNRQNMRGKVHASTNLSVEDLKQKYGERVFSRMKEMFNVITFPADAKDMRG